MNYTFRDLKFRPKKYDKKCISATLELEPKVFLSVVAGPGLYSSPGGINQNRDVFVDYPDSDEFQEWQVKGWQTREDINKLIIEHVTSNSK